MGGTVTGTLEYGIIMRAWDTDKLIYIRSLHFDDMYALLTPDDEGGL